MDTGALFRATMANANKMMLPLLGTGLGKRLMGRHFAVITYRGRKSGKEFTLPTGYQRKGNRVVIGVMAPDSKRWWRNFTGDGAPMDLQLGAQRVTGHAQVERTSGGGVRVVVTLPS